MGSLGIYVHVPFCVKKCNYCDFLSFPLKREDGLQRSRKLCECIAERNL